MFESYNMLVCQQKLLFVIFFCSLNMTLDAIPVLTCCRLVSADSGHGAVHGGRHVVARIVESAQINE